MIKTAALHVHHTFTTFLWRPLHYYDVKPLNLTFYGRRGRTTTKRIKSLRIQLQEKVACIWHIERVQIDAIKFERTQIHFLATFSLPSSSSLLKVPDVRCVWTSCSSPGRCCSYHTLQLFLVAQKANQYSVNTALISDKENICKWKPSLRSRRLQVVGERENGRARGRHACPLACLLARPFFLVPTTSKRLLRRLVKATLNTLRLKQTSWIHLV